MPVPPEPPTVSDTRQGIGDRELADDVVEGLIEGDPGGRDRGGRAGIAAATADTEGQDADRGVAPGGDAARLRDGDLAAAAAAAAGPAALVAVLPADAPGDGDVLAQAQGVGRRGRAAPGAATAADAHGFDAGCAIAGGPHGAVVGDAGAAAVAAAAARASEGRGGRHGHLPRRCDGQRVGRRVAADAAAAADAEGAQAGRPVAIGGDRAAVGDARRTARAAIPAGPADRGGEREARQRVAGRCHEGQRDRRRVGETAHAAAAADAERRETVGAEPEGRHGGRALDGGGAALSAPAAAPADRPGGREREAHGLALGVPAGAAAAADALDQDARRAVAAGLDRTAEAGERGEGAIAPAPAAAAEADRDERARREGAPAAAAAAADALDQGPVGGLAARGDPAAGVDDLGGAAEAPRSAGAAAGEPQRLAPGTAALRRGPHGERREGQGRIGAAAADALRHQADRPRARGHHGAAVGQRHRSDRGGIAAGAAAEDAAAALAAGAADRLRHDAQGVLALRDDRAALGHRDGAAVPTPGAVASAGIALVSAPAADTLDEGAEGVVAGRPDRPGHVELRERARTPLGHLGFAVGSAHPCAVTARAAEGFDDHRGGTDAVGADPAGGRHRERGRAAGPARPERGLVGGRAPRTGVTPGCADPHGQEGLPHGRDRGRQGQGDRAGIAAAAEIRQGVTAWSAHGIDPESGRRPERRLPGRVGLVALPGHVLRQQHRHGAATTALGAEDRTRAVIVAPSAAPALRADLDRRRGVTPGGCGIDIDQAQVAAIPAGRRRGVPLQDEDFPVLAIRAGDHLGLGALGGARRPGEALQGDQADRRQKPCGGPHPPVEDPEGPYNSRARHRPYAPYPPGPVRNGKGMAEPQGSAAVSAASHRSEFGAAQQCAASSKFTLS